MAKENIARQKILCIQLSHAPEVAEAHAVVGCFVFGDFWVNFLLSLLN